ncbi:MAG: UvrD-helicase domain-containing protein [Cryomorphaceae bacterium]|nr:UvrD-helicase domain-containing protein [Cryomorphaceae bacterium]
MEHILGKLNLAQREAVVHTKGPCMIIAGAGSGKTRVLTYRIAYLMEKEGVDPFNILSLTFTNKAAREMKHRVGVVVGNSESQNLWMGTFHSVFARILRAEASKIGYPSNFTIYDSEDAKKLIGNIVKEKGLDKDIYKTKTLAGRISSLKNNLITPKMYERFPELREQDEQSQTPKFKEVYQTYCERCFKSGAMDFDDLLLKTNELLATYPTVLAKYQDRFRYIMVDEYQDTNHSQYIIVKALASRFENICVVGDDAQSIYAFRGANIRNILNFQKDYPDAKTFKLEQNYRSTKNIVSAANSLIANNKNQLEKDVWTENDSGEKIIVHKSLNENQEAFYVAERIIDFKNNQDANFGQSAVLYRTNAQTRALEEALRKKGIPYRIYGGLSFYQRKEIKDLLAYLRLAINQKDEEAFRRVINYPARGIGATTIDKIVHLANERDQSIWEIAENIQFFGNTFNRGADIKIANFVRKIENYANMVKSGLPADEIAEEIAKNSGLMPELAKDKTPEGVSRYENLQELMASIKDFVENQKNAEEGDPSLENFLSEIALITDSDTQTDEDEPAVSLMTIHQAKGLEFPFVYIVGMEENLFPNIMTLTSRADLEEERRLFYVALTRAEKQVYLTYCQTRYRWGKLNANEPSRFLDEIEDKYLQFEVPEFSPFDQGNPRLFGAPNSLDKPPLPKKKSMAAKNNEEQQGTGGAYAVNRKNLRPLTKSEPEGTKDTVTLKPNERVIHEKFGRGLVISVEGTGPNAKATIRFEKAGEKTLLMKFARVRKLG